MKTILKTGLIALAIMLSMNVSAQTRPVTFGVKGGVNLYNYRGDIEDTKAKVGFNVGLTVELALPSNFCLMSGLELTTKGDKNFEISKDPKESIFGYFAPFRYFANPQEMEYIVIPRKTKVECTLNATYLQLPIHLGYKMNILPSMKIIFHAGPYVAYGIGGKVKLGDNITFKYSNNILITMPLTDEIMNEWRLSQKSDTFGKDGLKEFDFGLGVGVGAEFGKIGINLGSDLGLTNISRDKDEKINTMNAHLSLGYKF